MAWYCFAEVKLHVTTVQFTCTFCDIWCNSPVTFFFFDKYKNIWLPSLSSRSEFSQLLLFSHCPWWYHLKVGANVTINNDASLNYWSVDGNSAISSPHRVFWLWQVLTALLCLGHLPNTLVISMCSSLIFLLPISLLQSTLQNIFKPVFLKPNYIM